jgi:broad specificity phosphatase PhoE
MTRDVESQISWPTSPPPLPQFIPLDRPVALLLRHAERPPIPPGQTGNSLGLTEYGERTAELFGHALGSRINGIRTSPVQRCIETAEALRMGAAASIQKVSDTMLGDPGAYVHDPVAAWQNWEKWGHEGVIERLVAGQLVVPTGSW